jgi:hypothetical protein
MLSGSPKTSNESGGVLQPKVMTASELEELKKEAQVHNLLNISELSVAQHFTKM